MKAIEEEVRSSRGLSFSFREKEEPLSFCWHFHRDYELLFVEEGRGRRFVGDDIAFFEPGDLALIGPYLPHAYETLASPEAPGARAIIIHFPPALFIPDRLRLTELRAIRRLLACAGNGLAFAPEAVAAVAPLLRRMSLEGGLGKLIDLTWVLDRLARSPSREPIAGDWYHGESPGAGRETGETLQFIFAHAAEPLSLAAVAKHVGRSISSVCRLFRKNLGCTFTEYLTRIRLGRACSLLIQTDHPIYAVSYRAGFENLSNFNRRFLRAKGMTPSAYRRLHRLPREVRSLAGRA